MGDPYHTVMKPEDTSTIYPGSDNILEKSDSLQAIDAFIDNLEGYIALYVQRAPRGPRDNILAAMTITTFFKKIGGACMFEHYLDAENKVRTSFSYLGALFVLFWYSLFFYCCYIIFRCDQTILLRFHKTALQDLGDDAEIFLATLYVILTMLKIPIGIARETKHIQAIIDADIALRAIGIPINYKHTARVATAISLLEFLTGGLHAFSVWISLVYHKSSKKIDLPYALIYHVVFFHAAAMVTASHYCYYLHVLRIRFQLLNDRICEVRDSNKFGRFFNAKARMAKKDYNILLAANMRSCASLYSLLSEGAFFVDRKLGFLLLFTMTSIVFYAMLNVSYLIEAHVKEIYNQNINKYLSFLNYIVWEIIYGFLIVYFIVYFCEWTKSEASLTASHVHQVINEDIDPTVNTVCMQFSLQLIHLAPSRMGVYRLNYELLLKECRTMAYILTFMYRAKKYYRYIPSLEDMYETKKNKIKMMF